MSRLFRHACLCGKRRSFSSFSHCDQRFPKEKLLFTPGPLTTSFTTKLAACRDLGSRDIEFIQIIRTIRQKLLQIARVSENEFTTILMQGSGTFGLESVLSSVIPKNRKVVIIANGAYGLRMVQMAKAHNISYHLLTYEENQLPKLNEIEEVLKNDKNNEISHVAVVESETTSGIINDVNAVGKVVHKFSRSFIVDAMSSFGCYETDLQSSYIDYLITSANKNLEGIPGFSIIIARKNALNSSKGSARTLSLDIHTQLEGLDSNGQFRFTPPTHSILAFSQALRELEQEGGVPARRKRYESNQQIVSQGLSRLGYDLYLKDPKLQGCIISSFHYPRNPKWNFQTFYQKLNDLNFVIYPGKLSKHDCFRIGHVGRIFPEDSANLVKAIESVNSQMK